MTEQSVFEPTPAAVVPQPTAEPVTPAANPADQLLSMVVNDQGQPKYNSMEDAIKGLVASQQHIAKIETENATLRQASTEAKSVDDILAAVQASKGEQEPAQPAAPTTPQVTEDDIAKLIGNSLDQRAVQEKVSGNVSTVTARMQELFGDKAEETFYAKASEKGLDRETINSIAGKSPQAVFDLFGIESATSPATPAPTHTSVFGSPGNNEPAKAKSAMGYITTKELLDSWNATGAATRKRLGIEG